MSHARLSLPVPVLCPLALSPALLLREMSLSLSSSTPWPSSFAVSQSVLPPLVHSQEGSTPPISSQSPHLTSFNLALLSSLQQSYRFISEPVRKHNSGRPKTLSYNTLQREHTHTSFQATCPTTAATTTMPCRGPPRSRGDRVPPCPRTSPW